MGGAWRRLTRQTRQGEVVGGAASEALSSSDVSVAPARWNETALTGASVLAKPSAQSLETTTARLR